MAAVLTAIAGSSDHLPAERCRNVSHSALLRSFRARALAKRIRCSSIKYRSSSVSASRDIVPDLLCCNSSENRATMSDDGRMARICSGPGRLASKPIMASASWGPSANGLSTSRSPSSSNSGNLSSYARSCRPNFSGTSIVINIVSYPVVLKDHKGSYDPQRLFARV